MAGDTVMTGSFPIFGQPVMNEGLMGTTAWLRTLAALERWHPQHILPGHGPLASAHDLALFKRLQRYFPWQKWRPGWRSRCPWRPWSPISNGSCQSGSLPSP